MCVCSHVSLGVVVLLKVKSGLKNSLLIRGIYTSGQVTCNGSTTLQDNMRHVLQHSHGRITHAYKGENHLATFEIRATLLRVNTTLCNVVRMFVRPNATIRIAKCCLWIRTCSKVRGDLMRPFYRIKQMRCIMQRKRQDVRIAKFTIAKCFKAFGQPIVKAQLKGWPDWLMKSKFLHHPWIIHVGIFNLWKKIYSIFPTFLSQNFQNASPVSNRFCIWILKFSSKK